MNEPDKITLIHCETMEIAASSATATVVISGDSFIFGHEALKKAKAVSRFVETLKANGIDENAATIVSVTANSASGVFTRSTTARYVLRIKSIPLESIPAFIDSVSDQKDISLNALKWNYTSLESSRDTLLARSIERLKSKGDQVAGSLGVTIIGIYGMKEEYQEPEIHPMELGATRAYRAKAAEGSAVDFGLNFNHLSSLSLKLSLTFRISEIKKA